MRPADNKVKISRVLFRSYGASFAVEMQQNGVQSAYKDMYHKAKVKNCHFTQYYNENSTQSKSQWLHGEHTQYAISLHFLLDLKNSI